MHNKRACLKWRWEKAEDIGQEPQAWPQAEREKSQRVTKLPERVRTKINPENDKVCGGFLYLSRSLVIVFTRHL